MSRHGLRTGSGVPFLTETVSAVDKYVDSQSDYVLQLRMAIIAGMLSSKGQHASLCDSDAIHMVPPTAANLLGSSPLEISITSCSTSLASTTIMKPQFDNCIAHTATATPLCWPSLRLKFQLHPVPTSLASTTEPHLDNCTAQEILHSTPCLPVGDKSPSAFPDLGSAPPILRESTNLASTEADTYDWTFLFNGHGFTISAETAHTSSLEQPSSCQGDLTDEAPLLLSPNTILSSLFDMQAEDVDEYFLSEALDLDFSEGSNFDSVEGSSSTYSLTPSTSRSSSDSLASSGYVPSLPGTPAEMAAGGPENESLSTGSADPHISLFSSPPEALIWLPHHSSPHTEQGAFDGKVNWTHRWLSARERELQANDDEKSVKVRKYKERKKVQLDTAIGEWIHLKVDG
ncbi:hypothetical protein C8R47DRAFT_1269601 [Mycena vitilis]|nr:hypothetical protein C8R47DRAFT_1269601 [Mycena vitilis]